MKKFLQPFSSVPTVKGRMLAMNDIPGAGMEQRLGPARTTIGLKGTTKDKLDRDRAPGQCYDGFLCQLVDLWEKSKGK